MKRAFLLISVLVGAALLTPWAFAASEIILDNPSATFVGVWSTGTSSTDKYGTDYRYIFVSTSGGATATYTPTIPATSSDWAVYVWYPKGTNRPTQAQHIVRHAGGDSTFYLNQQANGGMWNLLGTFTMNAGTGNYVQVTNYGSETTKVVMADAVRFYSASSGGPDTTPPVISAVASFPGYDTAMVNWTTDEAATSQVEYGLTTSYGSQTTKDTNLVTSHSVQLTSLTPDVTYHYRVKSEDAAGNPAVSGDYTFTTSSTPPSGSLRASWLDSWGEGFHTASEVSSVIDTLYAYNYNALVFEARKRGDAAYNSSYEYKDPNISPPSFDPLADMIAKAHAKDMEIHAWLVAYRIASIAETNAPPIYWEHKNDWLMKNSAGATSDGSNYHFDPGVPGVQDYICKVVMDIVTHYDVDGINFDYIRYPGNNWGYNDLTKQRFYNEYGYWPPTTSAGAGWSTWCDYRRQQVTDLVKKCYLEIMAVKPNVKVSICAITWGGITDFTTTSSYTSVFQDWRKWMQDHMIDISMPMNYKREHDATQANDYRAWSDFAINNRYGRHTNIIQAAYLNYITNSLTQLNYPLNRSADGVSTYDYWSTNIDGQTKETFYNTVRTNIFTSHVPIPDMPWKTAPTTGIIFGTVTNAAKPNDPIYANWIYKADVQVTGPVTRSTTTDATGTYGFIDLPPGVYDVTVSKTGFPSRTYTGQSILAGDVVREDFDLGYTTASSPSGAVSAGWSLFSLPLQPVNPDPVAVLPGIRIDGYLYRWDKPTQSQIMYDEWAPAVFGDLNTDEGYWLAVDSAYTISYQSYGGSAAMKDISLPSAGWSMVGCPFNKSIEWENAKVTHSGITVPIRNAAKDLDKGWLSSFGFWWDSPTQSQYDIGLPEDWPTTTQMQPWQGYWINSSVNDLTLTLR